jgi:cytochrome c biogenesis protein CcdA
MGPPRSVVIISEYGWLSLLVPLAWIVVALELQRRAEDEGVAALIAYSTGLFVLLLLLVTVSYLVLGPGFGLFLRSCN